MSSLILYGVMSVLLLVSWRNNKQKTIGALNKAKNMLIKLTPELLAILLFVGLSLSIMTPEFISSFIGEQSGVLGIAVATVVGSFAMLPGFVVFPLAETLTESGAGLPQVSALIASLMSVGFASLPLELKLFGKKFTYLRNLSAVLMALIFAAIVWVVQPWL